MSSLLPSLNPSLSSLLPPPSMHLIHSPRQLTSTSTLQITKMSLPFPSATAALFHRRPSPPVLASALATRRTRRKKAQQQTREPIFFFPSSSPPLDASHAEKSLRFAFMEELMRRARARDPAGVSEAFHDMLAAGLRPGPRSFHALVVSHALVGDEEGANYFWSTFSSMVENEHAMWLKIASTFWVIWLHRNDVIFNGRRASVVSVMQSLKREVSAGLCPLHETFICLVRLFGSKGDATGGLEILAAMEKMNYDIRRAWLILVEELVKNKYLKDASQVFLKGAEGGLRATDELYDLLIEEDCKAGDHENALTIAYEMEAAGRMATTFHFNCLLSVQATCGVPEVALATFENMEYGGQDYMKPDTETYNWLIQAYTRAESYDRVQNVAELLGMMVEDRRRLQPNLKTYALLVECFTKYSVVCQAVRHFRALKNFPGGTKALHNGGDHGDPLSLYLRALCREGRIVELLEALEAMLKDNQPIPPRAMILNRRHRSLVSSWIEPLYKEANVGFEIDYFARYVAEGGLTGERKRWVLKDVLDSLDPDTVGFTYSDPRVTSFKKHCLEEWRLYNVRLLRTLRNEGPAALGNVDEPLFDRVEERLIKIVVAASEKLPSEPKAVKKMLVNEMKEELEAQGLPIDGTREVLYRRVEKARRINHYRNRPLWVPPAVEEKVEDDEELDELISRIELKEGNTEFWKRRFLGEENPDLSATTNDANALENATVEAEGEDAEEEKWEGVEAEQSEGQADAQVKKKKDGTLQMFIAQLLKDSGKKSTAASKLRDSDKKSTVISMIEEKQKMLFRDETFDLDDGDGDDDGDYDEDEDDDNDEDDDDIYFPLNPHEALKEMRNRKMFDVSDMYTVADSWGWTWEKELKKQKPRRWSEEWEAEVAIKIMEKVIELGGTPTIEDCAMVLRAAIRAPLPSSFLRILQLTHKLGYTFGGSLYDEVIRLCLDLGERDAAVAMVADMETTGRAVPDETLDMVLSAE